MSIKKLTLIPLLLLAAASANAQVSNQEFAKCAAIDGDLQRLECFDALGRAKGLNKPQAQATGVTGTGKWQVDVETNPIDDSTTATLILPADSGKSSWGKPIYLVARCQSNKTDLYINWQDYLGSEAVVLTRVGTAKATTAKWGMSTDKQATFHGQPIAFLKQMLGSNKLVAQVTPYNESPTTAIFDTTGLANAIKPLRETCNW